MVRAGKVRYLGFSNWPAWLVATAAQLQRQHGWAPFVTGQMHYSLANRDLENEYVPMAAHHGIGTTVWSPLAGGFLTGKYPADTRAGDGRLRGEFRLWDVYSGRQIAGEQFYIPANTSRRLAHIIADSVYERLTGEKGYFDSRVVFVDETGPKNDRVKRLAIMDQDGANLRLLTQGRELVLTPRFHPLSQPAAAGCRR